MSALHSLDNFGGHGVVNKIAALGISGIHAADGFQIKIGIKQLIGRQTVFRSTTNFYGGNPHVYTA